MPKTVSNDVSCHLYQAAGMDEKAIHRAALIVLRCVVLRRFPPGPERDSWLAWLERLDVAAPAIRDAIAATERELETAEEESDADAAATRH